VWGPIILQCNGPIRVTDACGCARIARGIEPQLASQAQSAWMACVAVGCCGPGAHPISPPSCPPCSTAMWGTCDPTTEHCVPQ
jgi:hypothetical protein